MLHFRHSILQAILLFALAFPTYSYADVIVPKDTVSGIVIGKNKEPIPGAKVEIVGQPYSTFTDIDGRFNIKCENGAKKVLVSYPKTGDIKKKITPDMTIQIGRSWRDAPTRYQWFVGANIGMVAIVDNLFEPSNYDEESGIVATNISVMAGRVKEFGWYAKGFVAIPYGGGYDGKTYAAAGGGILGGMFRLFCPLHIYAGAGIAYSGPKAINNHNNHGNDWNHLCLYSYRTAWLFDAGLLYRIRDNFGINVSMNMCMNEFDISDGSAWNIGFNYFFN